MRKSNRSALPYCHLSDGEPSFCLNVLQKAKERGAVIVKEPHVLEDGHGSVKMAVLQTVSDSDVTVTAGVLPCNWQMS